MKLIILKCPSCGAQLSVEEGRDYTFCQYCGTKIILEKDNVFIYRHIDDADIKRAETERIIKLKELEIEERSHKKRSVQKIAMLIWAIFTGIIISTGFLLCAFEYDSTIYNIGGSLLNIGFIGGAFGAFIVFYVLRNRSRKNNTNDNSNKYENHIGQDVTPHKGINLKYRINLSSEEASSGATKQIQINREEQCDMCNGKGFMNSAHCIECNGTGLHKVIKPLNVKIPAGVSTGKLLIIKGEGDAGAHGGPYGDLFIEIQVK